MELLGFSELPEEKDRWEMRSNALVVELCSRVEQERFDWDTLAEKLKQRKRYAKKDYLTSDLYSIFSEIFYQDFFERMAQEYGKRVDACPIQGNLELGDFRYYFNANEQLIVEKGGTGFCELDTLSVVDNLPLVWEVKLSQGKKAVEGATSIRRQVVLGEALHGYFGSSAFAYGLVLPPETLDLPDFAVRFATFKHYGGNLIRFPYNQNEYSRLIAKVSYRHGIPIKHEFRRQR